MGFKWMIYIAVALLWSGCKGKKDNTYQDIVRPVRVVNVESLGAINKLYTGVVEAEEYSNLAFKLSGPLIAMNVDEGQKVKKGQVIAAVDPLDYRLQFEANKAAYLTAKSQLERNRRLLSMQAISQQEYEIAEANYIKGKSAYETSANTLEDTKLRAPFDGFVEKKFVENYQKVNPGESIIKLVNPNKLAVGFTLPETSVDLTRTPMTVTVEFDTYKGIWFKAKVKEFIDASPDDHSTIAHGYLTLSMLPYLWNQIIQVNNLKMMINYGMDKMKFGQAVLSGQSIRLVTTLHSLTNLRGVAKAEIKFAIEIKDQPKKALEGIAVFLYYFN